MIQDLDEEVKRRMVQLPSKVDPAVKPLREERNHRKTSRRTEPLDLRLELYRAFGVDLTKIPGINPLTAQVLLTEVGPDLSRFTAAAFCSRTRPTKNRAALALRLAAQALHNSQTFLRDYFRRMKARLGPAKAIAAVEHKLARIVYHLLTNQLEYDAMIFQDQERRAQDRKRSRILAQARELGQHLLPEVTVP